MNGEPVLALSGFGDNEELTERDIIQAEEYLVRVWCVNRKTTATTFDLLRLEYYTCYSQGIDGLPPTTSVIKGHLRRGAFSLQRKSSIIALTSSPEQELPEHNEWSIEFGMYLPKKNLRSLPDKLTATCNCGTDCKNR